MFKEMINFVEAEEEVLNFWENTNAFQACQEVSRSKPAFTFYDGPPFATGLPHYGHLLAGSIKDTVARFWYQQGYKVDRRFGWDCHGLPVEYEIDKELGIGSRDEVLNMGVDRYNEKCKAIVTKYSNEWKYTVRRMGRWVDFENGYKTMDMSFMESVWYVFSVLFTKGYVYRGYRVMPFSTACSTPLSNFEANQNYKDVSDPSVLVSFPIYEDSLLYKKLCSKISKNEFASDEDGNRKEIVVSQSATSYVVSAVAWTTTPWTLPSNCALFVNAEFLYAFFELNSEYFIMLESRVKEYFPSATVLWTLKGSELVGTEYYPPFEYYSQLRPRGFFRMLASDFISDSDGTGIVHAAPGFGEEDYKAFVKCGLINENDLVPCPVDENGRFTEEITQYKGRYVKDCDKDILRDVKHRILMNSRKVHRYPFCWRSDTPLLYKLVPNWFIEVTPHISKLLDNNELVNWVPEDIKYKKFHNWLEHARDWSISRNRFWGTPIPLWVSDDYAEVICVGSVAELERLSGRKIVDIHREFIDDIVLYKNGKELRRIDEVFDCWFESGSMPYAQDHWPFEESSYRTKHNRNFVTAVHEKAQVGDTAIEDDIAACCEKLSIGGSEYDLPIKAGFPANFIAEGIDQTRGWFYTLHVISTLLFDRPAYLNVIVNGIVLAEDGKKMSKRLKNYPDTGYIFNNYGADSLRMYLLSSPVVEAENLRFCEKGVREITKILLIPWYNSLSFYKDCVKMRHGKISKEKNGSARENVKSICTKDNDNFCPNIGEKSAQHSHAGGMGISSKFRSDVCSKHEQARCLPMDDWIRQSLNNFRYKMTYQMKKFELSKILPLSLSFLDDLSNWYIRINRKQIRSGSYVVLGEMLCGFSIAMAPFTPFFSEYCYQSLEPGFTVHMQMMAPTSPYSCHMFELSKSIIECIRQIREQNGISLKTPLKGAKVVCSVVKSLNYIDVIKYECNLLNLELDDEKNYEFEINVKPNFEELKKDKPSMKQKMNVIQSLTSEEVNKLQNNFEIKRNSVEIRPLDVHIDKKLVSSAGLCNTFREFSIIVDNSVDEQIMEMKISREFNSQIQKMRKLAGLKIEDSVSVYVSDIALADMVSRWFDIEFVFVEGTFASEGTFKFRENEVKIGIIHLS